MVLIQSLPQCIQFLVLEVFHYKHEDIHVKPFTKAPNVAQVIKKIYGVKVSFLKGGGRHCSELN